MEKTLDAILIDDDYLVQGAWELSAIQKNKCIKLFQSPSQFFAQSKYIPHETPIYIDSNLSHKLKGEFVAKEIHEQGFKNIYLTTGFSNHELTLMPWIKGVLDKNPPWENE